jgi:hypothetical protein
MVGPLGWRIVYPATNISRNFFRVSSCLQATKRHAAATSYYQFLYRGWVPRIESRSYD